MIIYNMHNRQFIQVSRIAAVRKELDLLLRSKLLIPEKRLQMGFSVQLLHITLTAAWKLRHLITIFTTCVAITRSLVLLLHGDLCCYYTVTCVAITRSLVLLLHGDLCCYYTVTCVAITRSLVLLLHGDLCCYYTRSLVLLLHGHLCCYYTVTCVAITRWLVLLLHGHFEKAFQI